MTFEKYFIYIFHQIVKLTHVDCFSWEIVCVLRFSTWFNEQSKIILNWDLFNLNYTQIFNTIHKFCLKTDIQDKSKFKLVEENFNKLSNDQKIWINC